MPSVTKAADLYTRASVALLALAAQHVAGQSSCVQTVGTSFSDCPCDAATFTFSLEGQTAVVANTVNLAVVLDGSGSVGATDWELEKGFAKDAVAAFAARNLFDNGGTASYVQFSSVVWTQGTYASEAEYNAAVDADAQVGRGTDIEEGVAAARAQLNGNPSSASFMIVITDGVSASDPKAEADAARAEGTTIFAVGVGTGVDDATLLAIGGESGNVFDIADFEQLNDALSAILATGGSSVVPCPSTGASITVDFVGPVSSATPDATISANAVVYTASDLELGPVEFQAVLDTCAVAAGTGVVAAVTYSDDQANTPDLTPLLADVVSSDCKPATTPAVTPAPMTGGLRTPSPPTGAPVGTPTPVVPTVTSPPVDDGPRGEYDCSVCSNLTPAQVEALGMYDNGGKKVVCDPTCVDGVSDPSHCNYFGLGQVCRGCGDCSVCTPCP